MHFIIVALILTLPLTAAGQDSPRPLTPVEKALLRYPADVQLAPDGKRAAYSVREADTAANRWITHVHVVDVSANTQRQLTFGDESCVDPQWSPDGTWLAFLSSRPALDERGKRQEGRSMLFAFPRSGEARLLAAAPRDIEEYAWSPDGRSVALLTEGELPSAFGAETARRKARQLDITVSGEPSPSMELWLLDVSSGALRRVTELDPGAEGLAWFPDGRRLVYQTNYTGKYDDEQKWDLWSVTTEGEKEQLTDTAGPEHAAKVSPDGSAVAFLSQTLPDVEFAKTEISILDLGTRQLRRLTAQQPLSVEDFTWDPDGASLLALFNDGTSATLHRVDRSSGAARQLTDDALVIQDMDMNAAGDIAFIAGGVGMLREVHVLDRGGVRRCTDFSAQLADFRLGQQRVITVRSRDGLFDIEAVLVLPPDYTTGDRVPLLLAYHGGPYGDFDNRFYQYYPAHILAARGMATVMPNVRGSSGYDDAFGQANRYDLGGGDYRDAMDVVDYLVRQGIADSSRMAVMGGSYGGYMTNWTISQTPRFKAAVSMYGIFSWLTDWSNSWQPSFERMFFGYDYWEKPLDENSLWISRAPQTYVRNITTPTLILQGDADVYTNVSNSREMYQALNALGREVTFVVYHGAGHGIRTFPNQWVDVMQRTIDWITERVGLQ
ncbi:MAG: S9 family peptidase [Bacteroidota bacterium]|nr:S9 family peptidase [Bacteroidota bacterium]